MKKSIPYSVAMAARAFEEPRYTGAGRRRLRATAAGKPLAAALALALALPAGGCSTSYQLGALFGKDDAKADAPTAAPVAASGRPAAAKPPDADLAIAKAAAAELLTRGGKDASLPWENPRTGARGTVTPIASAYNQDGLVCHDFLASYVRGEQESWYQGGACRVHGGRWEVRDIRPLQRT